MRAFTNFVVIDWSGDKAARQKGIAVAHARPGDAAPVLLKQAGGWSRTAVADWLVKHAAASTDALIALDLSPGLPFVDHGAYFPGWDRSPADARALWALVDELAADEPNYGANRFLAHPEAHRHFRHAKDDCGDLFEPGVGRLREAERAQRAQKLSPYSCFNLIGAAQVGKSSLTGMRVLHALAGRLPIWPFDPLPPTGPVIVEIYTALAARAAKVRGGTKIRDRATLDAALNTLDTHPHALLARYDDHSTDAIVTAAWLRANATRAELWAPRDLTSRVAETEGWTFGVT